jgi:hypothetical protein
VALIYEIGKRARTELTEYGPKIVEFLWRLAIPGEQNIDKVLINQAAVAIPEIIRNWDNNTKVIYIKRLIESLRNVSNIGLCYQYRIKRATFVSKFLLE